MISNPFQKKPSVAFKTKFQKGDILLSPLFHEERNKVFFAKVIDPINKLCSILSQEKIKGEMEGSIFIYTEDSSRVAYKEYKELYPEEVL